MPTSLTIGGVAVALPADAVLGTLVAFTRDGYPSLSLYVRSGKLPATPDPYLAKEAVLTVGGSVVFRGDVASAHPESQPGLGWVTSYQCHGSAARTERIPYTNEADGTGTGLYNATPEDPAYNAARAGRTVGQILTDVISAKTNGDNLTSKSIGNLTWNAGTGVYSLPANTANDLAALTRIPNGPVYVSGEKIWHALSGFVAEHAPNHLLHVEPGGDIRILDLRAFTGHTFTMGTDPILPSELSRDCGASFPRVQVRGAPIAVMALLKQTAGTLNPNFVWGSYATNAAAEAAWTPAQFHQPSAQDTGTLTCPDTLHVVVTSSSATAAWVADYWDQTATGRHGVINISSTTITGITQFWTARIVANTALSAGGTSTLTLDNPLPALTYDHYTITGINAQDSTIVWRKYTIANTSLWPKVTSQSTFPQAFVNPGGGATLTSTPIGAVLWPISGTGPPYNTFPLPFTYDGNGNIYFAEPTYVVANNAAPADVWALLPINVNPNVAVAPADAGGVAQYSGTSHTVEGISDTLVVNVPSWRDPANLANMQAYAQEILDAVSNTVQEGGITYLGLFQAGLTPGLAASVTGNTYTTGWESAALPVVECSLTWNPMGPTSWTTTMRCSNRRAYLGAEAFLRPARSFVPVGAGVDPFFGLQPVFGAAVGAYASGVLGGLISETQYSGEIATPMTPAEQEQTIKSQQQYERQAVERQRQLEQAPMRAEQEAAQRQKAMEEQIAKTMGPAGRPESRTPEEQQESHHAAVEARQQQLERRRQAEAARAAQVAMEAEQRQGLPAGGSVSTASPEQVAAIAARGQEQRQKDAGQVADITAREQARAARAREDIATSAPRIAAEGRGQHEKEMEQGRAIGEREQARAQRGRKRGQDMVEEEQQHAADRRAVDERRGQELAEEQEARRRQPDGDMT